MCSDQIIANIDHSRLIKQNQIKESKSTYASKLFAITFPKFLSGYCWWSHDNSNIINLVQDNYNKELKSYLQVPGKENQMSVSNSIETLNEVTFETEESFLLDQSKLSTLNYESTSDPFEKLKNTRLNLPNRLIIVRIWLPSKNATQ